MDDPENPAVECWACNVLIGVPFSAGRKPAEMFKCGWCGALNRLDQLHTNQQLPGPASTAHHQQCQHWHSHQHQRQLHIHRHPDTHASGKACQQHSQGFWQSPQPHVNLLLASQHPWQQQHQQQQSLAGVSTQSSPARRLLHSCSRFCVLLARWTVVAIVALLVCSISGTGILLLLPRLCTTWATYLPNLALAVIMLVNVVANYTASAVQNPGSVQELVVLPLKGPQAEVAQGSFEGWAYCRRCRWPKPPRTHHCRSCEQCVVDMDHHCPFINNCVGAGNLRPFLLFLVWTLLAAAYVIIMCSMLVWQQRDVVRATMSMRPPYSSSVSSSNSSIGSLHASNATAAGSAVPAHLLGSGSSSSSSTGSGSAGLSMARAGHSASTWLLAATGVFFVLLQMAPGWLLATYYMLAASLAMLLAVGMLLWSQLSYLARGVTYIQHLKGVSGGGSAGHAGFHAVRDGLSDGEAAKRVDSQQQHQQYDLSVVATATAATTGASVDSTNMLQQTQPPARKQQQHSSAAVGSRCWLLWLKVQEVLGAGSDRGSLLKALLVPRSRHPLVSAAAVATGKKWT